MSGGSKRKIYLGCNDLKIIEAQYCMIQISLDGVHSSITIFLLSYQKSTGNETTVKI